MSKCLHYKCFIQRNVPIVLYLKNPALKEYRNFGDIPNSILGQVNLEYPNIDDLFWRHGDHAMMMKIIMIMMIMMVKMTMMMVKMMMRMN